MQTLTKNKLVNDIKDLKINYGELEADTKFVDTCENLNTQLKKSLDLLEMCQGFYSRYNSLSTEEKVELDMLTAFAQTSVYYIYLRVKCDPEDDAVKEELERIKSTMRAFKQVKDHSSRPQVNKNVAKRFVRGALFDLDSKLPNKKIKFT